MAHSVQIEDRHLDSFSLCTLRLALCVMGVAQSRVLWTRILYFFSAMDLFFQTNLSQEGQSCTLMNSLLQAT
jgi:hypothetical protein